MKLNLTSDEAQIIVDELKQAARARYQAQPDYAAKCIALYKKILEASHKGKS